MPDPVGLNGLLPGRGPGLGAPGRGPGVAPPGWPGLADPGTGRGWPPSPVLAAGRWAAAVPGSGCENGTCGTPGAAGRPASSRGATAGPAAPSPGPAGPAGWPGPTGPAGWPAAPGPAGWPGTGAAAAVGRLSGAAAAAGWLVTAGSAAGAAGARPFEARLPPSDAAWPAAALAAAACPANASLSLRTTGASIVDDAERTNSPISWSLAMTALLSTPNSLASSYTRTFATTLPASARTPGQSAGPGQRMLRPASVGAVHRRVLIERSLQSQPVFPAQPAAACIPRPAITHVTARAGVPPAAARGPVRSRQDT